MKAKLNESLSELDAEFDLAFEGDFVRITLHARGGSLPQKRTNPDYEQVLQLILERLAQSDSTLHQVRLASKPVIHLPPGQRQLNLADVELPVQLGSIEDLTAVRLAIRRAAFQANNQSANVGHGNATKRIELVASCPLEPSQVAEFLEWGVIDGVKTSSIAVDERTFVEGGLVMRTHLQRERNQAVVALAKSTFKSKHGRLFCEVCGFDFEETFGELGADFIEAHHDRPLSELTESSATTVADLRMVCSNCHRILHRRRPWLSVDELRERVKL